MLKNLKERLSAIPANISAAIRQPRYWGFLVSLAVIALLSIAFFYPDATMGNALRQHDMQQGAAIGQEAKAYTEATGADEPRWTNSLFSGMPTFQISPSYPSDSLFRWINSLFGAGLPSPSNLRIPYTHGFNEGKVVLWPYRRHCLGILIIFRHNHRCRSYLEIRNPGIYSTNHSRNHNGIPRQMVFRKRSGSPVRHDADTKQPCADVILFPYGNRLPGNRLSCAGYKEG